MWLENIRYHVTWKQSLKNVIECKYVYLYIKYVISATLQYYKIDVQ